MSEIASSVSRVTVLGALAQGLTAATLEHSQQAGDVNQGILAATIGHQQAFPIASKFADLPVTAGIYFTAMVNTENAVTLSYLHVRQINGSQATVEASIAGDILESLWIYETSGKVFSLYSEGRDMFGTVLSSDLVCEAIIQSVSWDGRRLKLFAIGVQDDRPPRTLAIPTILFLQTRSTGQRSIRFPLVWGLQAGDTITHPTIDDLVIESFSMTVQPKYRVTDVTEAI